MYPDGALPPGFTDQSLSQAFKCYRADFRAKKLLKWLGHSGPTVGRPQVQLRAVLDTSAGRALLRKSDRQLPALHEAIYRRLTSCIFAERVYRDVIEPAEIEQGSKTFLDPTSFTARIEDHRELFRSANGTIPPESVGDALAQFVLAYGLVQDGRARVYDERDRDDDPREGLMRDLDLPRGEERELVVVRDRVYELDGEDSRTLAAVGAFRVVPEHDLDIDRDTLEPPPRRGPRRDRGSGRRRARR